MDSEKNAVKPRIDNYKYFDDELQDFKQAAQYALENIGEIMKKEALIRHTKYSGYISDLGCISPSLIADKTIGGYKKGRFLKEIPEKSDYTVYHFDENMNPIRYEMVFPGYYGTTYWFFEYRTKTYVMSFHDYTEIGKGYQLGSHAYKVEYSEFGIYKYTHFQGDNSFFQEIYDYDSLKNGYITCEKYSYVRINTNKSIAVGEQGSPITYWRFHVYTENNKVCKIVYVETINGINEEELIYEKHQHKKAAQMSNDEIEAAFNSWIDKVVEHGFPYNTVALNFELHEGTLGSYTMRLIASDSFDENNPDWACDVIFSTEDFFNICKSRLQEWESALKYCTKLVNGYLSNGKQMDKLKEYKAIGIGFTDGDIDILYRNE